MVVQYVDIIHIHILAQVLEGHVFLGTVPTLGSQASACFGGLVSSITVAAVQQTLPARPGGGPPAVATMHEAVRLLPAKFLQPALARV